MAECMGWPAGKEFFDHALISIKAIRTAGSKAETGNFVALLVE